MSLIQPSNVLSGSEPDSTSTGDPPTGTVNNAGPEDAGLEETRTVTPANDAEPLVNKAITLCRIRTDRISANAYNPNEMTKEEFAQLVAEARRLRRLPKPLKVRRVEGCSNERIEYELIDGEHGWRAANELGWEEVDCEVLDRVKDFEAMRQSYKCNCHGTPNPVLLGRMFVTMRERKSLSGRKLAETLGISEGTVRNAELYAKAADLRKHYAPDKADAEIAALTVEQVRAYVNMPADERDAWLDAGADMAKIKPAGGHKKRSPKPAVDDAPRCEPSTESRAVAAPPATPKETSPVNDDIHLVEPEPGRQESGTELALPDPSERAADERTEPEAPALSDSNEAHKAAERITAEWASASESGRLHFLRQLCSNSETVVMIKQVLMETEAPIAPTTSEGQ